jgi:hypothetical protein
MLRSRRMYDLCFRAIQGLPLPARSLTNFLIQSLDTGATQLFYSLLAVDTGATQLF